VAEYSMSNDILYGLTRGNLISYYRDEQLFLPWDDDVDVMVRRSDWYHILALWESGTNHQKVRNFTGGTGVFVRDVEMCGIRTLMYHVDWPVNGRVYPWFFKLRHALDPLRERTDVHGSVDLFMWMQHMEQSGREEYGVGPKNDETEVDYPIVEMCGIRARVPKYKPAMRYLDWVYQTDKWRLPRHPDLQDL